MKIRVLKSLFVFLVLCSSVYARPAYEIRAVWLTTVYGLDWPKVQVVDESSRTKQQEQLCAMLDRLQEANFNTVFLQVRLRGDVIYRSVIEPAAKVFSGKYGTGPGYDPLAFVVEECHKRGMECHAWFVTFPLGTEKNVKEQGKLSVVKRRPELCKKLNGEWYLDPGLPGTSDYILSLVKEIVSNYDVDGIHFDYIRYPEQADKFPDKETFAKYGKGKDKANWRRENINRMVFRIYDWVKSVKPWVQVSSSPLGKYSRITKVPNAGWTAYESVFQDPSYWMREGKHDMVVPMMYYLHDNFFPFVDNWVDHCNGRMIVPGLGAYRMKKEEADWSVNDITDQIDYSRYYGGSGCTFFRCSNVLDNTKGLYDELKDNYYKYPALLPPLIWLNDSLPGAPQDVTVERIGGELRVSWNKPDSSDVPLSYTVYCSFKDEPDSLGSEHILSTRIAGNELYFPVDTTREQGYFFWVTSSTRYRMESVKRSSAYYYLSEFEK